MSNDGSLRHWIFDRYLPQNLRSRSPETRRQYGFAVNDFAASLGREPTLADLTDDALAAMANHLLLTRERPVAPITANERVGRIKTFWRWAASRRKLTGVEEFPTIGRVPVPEHVPKAWREDELVKLFNACRHTRGDIAGVPAWRWWVTLHGWLWCTAERIGATLALRIDHLRIDERVAVVPAEIRKGRRKPMVYPLWADLTEMLREILPPKVARREQVWPFPYHLVTFYNRYTRLLERAGLPTDRRSKPHAMRVSHASWLEISGGNPTKALGHSSPETTRKSYIDPTLAKQDESKLFRPW
jgi:integrase